MSSLNPSGGERAPARAAHLRIGVHLVPLIQRRGARRQQCRAEENVSQNRPVKRGATTEPVADRRTDQNEQRDSRLRQFQVVSHALSPSAGPGRELRRRRSSYAETRRSTNTR